MAATTTVQPPSGTGLSCALGMAGGWVCVCVCGVGAGGGEEEGRGIAGGGGAGGGGGGCSCMCNGKERGWAGAGVTLRFAIPIMPPIISSIPMSSPPIGPESRILFVCPGYIGCVPPGPPETGVVVVSQMNETPHEQRGSADQPNIKTRLHWETVKGPLLSSRSGVQRYTRWGSGKINLGARGPGHHRHS